MEDYTTALPAGATQVTSVGLGVGHVFPPNFEALKNKQRKTSLCIRFDIVVFYQWKYEKSWGLRDVVCGVWRIYLNLWKLPRSWYWTQSSFYSASTLCFWDCFRSCWQVVPVSIHDLSVTLSGAHLANSEMDLSFIKTAGLPTVKGTSAALSF